MTDLEKLQKYMYPYYQDVGDETLLEVYLTDFLTPYCAASELWGELAPSIIAGKTVKSYSTGAERTEYLDPVKITQTCTYFSMCYARKCKEASGTNTSQAVLLTKPEIARGAKV